MKEFVDHLSDWLASDPNLTEAGLAKAAGLDNSTIRQMIKFRRNPRVDTAMRICASLGVSIEEFMSGAPRDPVTARLLRLMPKLDADERAQLLGYGEALPSRRLEEDQQ